MPYNIDDLLRLISEIRDRGEVTIRRDRYAYDETGWTSMIDDLRSVLKNAGFVFDELAPEPGVRLIQISPSQRVRLQPGDRRSHGVSHDG